MCPDIIFQILSPYSRFDMSCDYCVTCLFIVNKKKKEIQKKRNIKSRKIDKRKRKMLVFKVFYNSTPLLRFHFQRNFFFVLPEYLAHLLIPLILFQTFFQLLYIFFFPLLPIILLPIPIPLQFFQIFLIEFLIILFI